MEHSKKTSMITNKKTKAPTSIGLEDSSPGRNTNAALMQNDSGITQKSENQIRNSAPLIFPLDTINVATSPKRQSNYYRNEQSSSGPSAQHTISTTPTNSATKTTGRKFHLLDLERQQRLLNYRDFAGDTDHLHIAAHDVGHSAHDMTTRLVSTIKNISKVSTL